MSHRPLSSHDEPSGASPEKPGAAQLIDLAADSDTIADDRADIFSVTGVRIVKAAVVLAFFLGAAQPAGAQSLFGLFGDDSSATPLEKWKRTIYRQLLERAPRLNLDSGRVVVHFRVDRVGHVTDVKFEHYSSNAHALIVASMITSLKLPPPPPPVDRECCWLVQGINFH